MKRADVDAVNPSMSKENPFEVLGVAPHISLDDSVLIKAYLTLQKKYHPDCFVGSSDKNILQQKSEAINGAFQTLKHPITRLQALLEGQGIKDFENPLPSLLMEIMEWRQSLEEGTLNLSFIKEEIQKSYKKSEQYFLDKDWEQLKKIYMRLQYLEKIIDDTPSANL